MVQAAAVAVTAAQAVAATMEPCVHVQSGACDIAVPVAHAVAAVPMPARGLTPLPRRDSGALIGLLDHGGTAVPVVALDRWLPMGAGAAAGHRILVLRAGHALVGIRVDAVVGVQRIERTSIQRVRHDSGADELFEAVVPATPLRPLLCLLEVERLMRLSEVWSGSAGVATRRALAETARRPDTHVADPAPQAACIRIRHAVLAIGTELWALPAGSIACVARAAVAELKRAGQRTCGICAWQGRKMPLVDLGPGTSPSLQSPGSPLRPVAADATEARPWMAVVDHGPCSIGLLVTACVRFVDLGPGDIAHDRDDALARGTALVPALGPVRVLDIDKLFAAVPESRISAPAGAFGTDSRAPAFSTGAVAEPVAPTAAGAGRPYLVFEAERRYASPVDRLVGVMALPAVAIDDLKAGRRAAVEWRGRTLAVARLPSLDGGSAVHDPRLAVIVEGETDGDACSAVAIHDLVDWLPPHSARPSGLRLGSIGEVGMVTTEHGGQSTSLIVVDLAEMADLLN